MLKPQRRIFLKVIATGPLVGCAGADLGGSSEGGFAGSETSAAGGAVVAAGGKASASGGSPVSAAGSSVSAGGTSSNPFFNGGSSSSGGNPFASAGSSGELAGASTGGTTVFTTAGTGGAPVTANPGQLVANVSSVPIGAFGVAGGIFFLGRDAGGLYAMSMQCTHKFCALVILGSQLDCPCHHSRFDFAGNVLAGPATEPLPYFKVYLDAAGNISVDKYTLVSRTTRVAV